jgi:hypothetical protein
VLKIRYYSDGKTSDTFTVQYNAGTPSGSESNYQETEPVLKSEERGFHEAEVRLPGARFRELQNGGADFRIASGTDGDERISRLELVAVK